MATETNMALFPCVYKIWSAQKIAYIRSSVKCVYQKINFLISQPNICCGYSKEPSQMRRFFWASTTYVKTDVDKKIFTILLSEILFI